MNMNTKKCCLDPNPYEDYVTGDTICQNCGLCVHDILLDCFGQQPAVAGVHEHSTDPISYQKGKNLRHVLERVLSAMSVVEALTPIAYQMVDEIYSSGKSLQGSDLVHVALAITLKMCTDLNIHFDSNKVTSSYGPIMKRIMRLKEELFPGSTREDNSQKSPMLNRVNILENLIRKYASELGFEGMAPSRRLISEVSQLSKSGKVKASICLYIMYPDKLREIAAHLRRSQGSIRHSVKEISFMEESVLKKPKIGERRRKPHTSFGKLRDITNFQ